MPDLAESVFRAGRHSDAVSLPECSFAGRQAYPRSVIIGGRSASETTDVRGV
jgi:hypothetical protein